MISDPITKTKQNSEMLLVTIDKTSVLLEVYELQRVRIMLPASVQHKYISRIDFS
jgi:hypothetical protein